MPLSTGKGGYWKAFQILEERNLDGMEIEFVHGVRMSDETKQMLKKLSKEKKFVLTAHGPFYINLNSKEEEKVEASIHRIADTAMTASEFGGYSITYHAAFYMNKDKETVYEEIIRLSKEFEQVLPCVDFSHIHARTAGEYNTYDEFCKVLDRIGTELGEFALNNFHAHLAGIDYSSKGEKRHLILEDSDMNYKDLLKALKSFNVKGALVCESPNIETDTKILKDYYMSL